MSERTKLVLVSLWLLLSFTVNVVMLKQLIRTGFWVAAGLYAGLDRWRDAQYFLALIFVLWVIVLLLSGARLGRTLTVVLLLGSCCTIAGQLLLDMVCTLLGDPYWPRTLGWVMFGAIFFLNLACLRALAVRKIPECASGRSSWFFAKEN